MNTQDLSRIHADLDTLKAEAIEMKVFREKTLTILENNTKILEEHQNRSTYNENQLALLKQDLSKWRGILIGIGTLWSFLLALAYLGLRLWT